MFVEIFALTRFLQSPGISYENETKSMMCLPLHPCWFVVKIRSLDLLCCKNRVLLLLSAQISFLACKALGARLPCTHDLGIVMT